MKKLILPFLLGTSSLVMGIGPVNQMEGYTPSNIEGVFLNQVWNSMETGMSGDDCYRRAEIWAFDMWKDHHIKSKKIFLHYTDKWNKELDEMGGMSWFEQKTFNAKGISKSLRSLVRHNITWDYHVAPMILVDGKNVVMDRYLKLPYNMTPGHFTEKEFFEVKAKPASPEEWIEALTANGEMLWKARRAKIKEELDDHREEIASYQQRLNWAKKRGQTGKAKSYQARIDGIRKKMRKNEETWARLEMDQEQIDIKCQKIDSIAVLDINRLNAWCFWSEAPMFYYNEKDLRTLAYGVTNNDYSKAPPMDVQTEEHYRRGRNYVQTHFNQDEINDARKELTFSARNKDN